MTRFLSLHTLLTYSYLPVVLWVVGVNDATVGVNEKTVGVTEENVGNNEVGIGDDKETAGLIEVTVDIFLESVGVTVELGFTNKELAIINVACWLGEGTLAGEGINVIDVAAITAKIMLKICS